MLVKYAVKQDQNMSSYIYLLYKYQPLTIVQTLGAAHPPQNLSASLNAHPHYVQNLGSPCVYILA